jgi:hypothetical protein
VVLLPTNAWHGRKREVTACLGITAPLSGTAGALRFTSPRAPLALHRQRRRLRRLILSCTVCTPNTHVYPQAAPNHCSPLSTASISSPHTPPSLRTSPAWLTSTWPMHPRRRRRWPRPEPVLMETRSASKSRRSVQTLQGGCMGQS